MECRATLRMKTVEETLPSILARLGILQCAQTAVRTSIVLVHSLRCPIALAHRILQPEITLEYPGNIHIEIPPRLAPSVIHVIAKP